MIVKVINAHGMAYFFYGLGSDFAGFFCAFAQDVVNTWNVLFILLAALTHGLKTIVEYVEEEFLACTVAKASAGIVVFQLLQILVLGKEFPEVIINAKGIQI